MVRGYLKNLRRVFSIQPANAQARFGGGVFAFGGGCGDAAEHHLAAQPLVGGNLPRLGDGFVN